MSTPQFTQQVKVKLTGTDGNAFAIIAKVQRALKVAGFSHEAQTFAADALDCGSYDALLQLVLKTVNVR